MTDAFMGGAQLRASTSASHADVTVVNSLMQMFTQARDAKRQRYDNWIRNYRLVNNRYGNAGANWMPAPRDSEIYPVLSSIIAWMTDNQIICDYAPSATPNSKYYSYMQKLAEDMSAIVYTNWQVEGYKNQVKLMLWDTLTYGIGVLKNVWDNSLSGGYGNAVMKRVDPWSFYPDPHCSSFDDAEYMIEARRMSLDEIERRYPGSSLLVEAAAQGEDVDERPNLFDMNPRSPMTNPGNIPQSGTFGSIGGSGFGNWAMPSSRRPNYHNEGYVVYEFWLRENVEWHDETASHQRDGEPTPAYAEKHVQDRWRVVVVCAGQILMDEWADALWSHSQHPYERYVFDDIGEFYGISLVDHLAYPQIYINRLLTALEHNTELAGNPIFLEPQNSGTARIGIINRPGLRLPLSGQAANKDNRPAWLTPPQMPPIVMDLVQFWISRIESTSGLSAIVKGATPNQRNSEGVINSVQEAAFVRIRSAQANLEWTLARCVFKLTDLIGDNYTEQRVMGIVGQDGQLTSMLLASRHFYVPSDTGEEPLKFIMMVRAGAQLPTSRQARVAESDKLFSLGVIDDQALLEAHQYPNIPTVLARKYEKMQKGMLGVPGKRERARS